MRDIRAEGMLVLQNHIEDEDIGVSLSQWCARLVRVDAGGRPVFEAFGQLRGGVFWQSPPGTDAEEDSEVPVWQFASPSSINSFPKGPDLPPGQFSTDPVNGNVTARLMKTARDFTSHEPLTSEVIGEEGFLPHVSSIPIGFPGVMVAGAHPRENHPVFVPAGNLIAPGTVYTELLDGGFIDPLSQASMGQMLSVVRGAPRIGTSTTGETPDATLGLAIKAGTLIDSEDGNLHNLLRQAIDFTTHLLRPVKSTTSRGRKTYEGRLTTDVHFGKDDFGGPLPFGGHERDGPESFPRRSRVHIEKGPGGEWSLTAEVPAAKLGNAGEDGTDDGPFVVRPPKKPEGPKPPKPGGDDVAKKPPPPPPPPIPPPKKEPPEKPEKAKKPNPPKPGLPPVVVPPLIGLGGYGGLLGGSGAGIGLGGIQGPVVQLGGIPQETYGPGPPPPGAPGGTTIGPVLPPPAGDDNAYNYPAYINGFRAWEMRIGAIPTNPNQYSVLGWGGEVPDQLLQDISNSPDVGSLVGMAAGNGTWGGFDEFPQGGKPAMGTGSAWFLPADLGLSQYIRGDQSSKLFMLGFPSVDDTSGMGGAAVVFGTPNPETGGMHTGVRMDSNSSGLVFTVVDSSGVDTSNVMTYGEGGLAVTGNASVSGKLSVTGMIDPPGIAFSESSSRPAAWPQPSGGVYLPGLYAGDTAGANEAWWVRDDGSEVDLTSGGGAGSDTTAIHESTAAEFATGNIADAVVVAADRFLFEDASASQAKRTDTIQGILDLVASGDVRQIKGTFFVGTVSTTNALPYDSTTPQTSEMAQGATFSFTPTASDSRLLIIAIAHVGAAAARQVAAGLFLNSETGARSMSFDRIADSTTLTGLPIIYVMASTGSTTAQVWRIYFGGDTAGTKWWGRNGAGNTFGATPSHGIIIIEMA